MPHMTTYGDQMDQKWTGSAIKPSVCPSRSGPEVSVCLSVRPKHFPYLLDEHHARELQAQGACALRFLILKTKKKEKKRKKEKIYLSGITFLDLILNVMGGHILRES